MPNDVLIDVSIIKKKLFFEIMLKLAHQVTVLKQANLVAMLRVTTFNLGARYSWINICTKLTGLGSEAISFMTSCSRTPSTTKD